MKVLSTSGFGRKRRLNGAFLHMTPLPRVIVCKDPSLLNGRKRQLKAYMLQPVTSSSDVLVRLKYSQTGRLTV